MSLGAPTTPDSGSSAPSPSWVASLVLRLPAEARSSLRVERLPLLGFTDVRRAAAGNQDRIAVAYSAGGVRATDWLLAIVCDGVGGSSFGEHAASEAVATMAQEIARRRVRRPAADSLREAFLQSHNHIASLYGTRASTTVVALLVTSDEAVLGWVGDSRAYQVAGGDVKLITEDDTLAAATARAHPGLAFELNDEYGERLSQALGGPGSVVPHVVSWASSAPEAVCLLCTDGVWKPTEGVLRSLVESCADSAELLRRLLLTSDWLGGRDNASAILAPSVQGIRKFLADSDNGTPPGCFLLCLPGQLQVVLPLIGNALGQIAPVAGGQDDSLKPESNRRIPGKRLGGKRKGSPATTARKSADKQLSITSLVVEEDPSDDRPTDATGPISEDKSGS